MQKLTSIKLVRVHFMPKTLEPGLLYVSEEFGSALHLCACGCGTKISTPIAKAKWTVEETDTGPSLHPSVGNWQYPCKSHYWIHNGRIVWSNQWTLDQIVAGREADEERLRAHYESLDKGPAGILERIWRWFKSFFGY